MKLTANQCAHEWVSRSAKSNYRGFVEVQHCRKCKARRKITTRKPHTAPR